MGVVDVLADLILCRYCCGRIFVDWELETDDDGKPWRDGPVLGCRRGSTTHGKRKQEGKARSGGYDEREVPRMDRFFHHSIAWHLRRKMELSEAGESKESRLVRIGFAGQCTLSWPQSSQDCITMQEQDWVYEEKVQGREAESKFNRHCSTVEVLYLLGHHVMWCSPPTQSAQCASCSSSSWPWLSTCRCWYWFSWGLGPSGEWRL